MKKTKLIIGVLVVSLVAGAVFPNRSVLRSYAAKSTQEEINEKEREKNKLQNQLETQNDALSGMKGQKKSLQDELTELNESMLEVCTQLVELEGKINVKSQEIADNQEKLAQAIEREERQQEDMEIRARKMYERNTTDYLTSLLQAGSLGQLLNLATWFERVETYDKDRLKEYQEAHANIAQIEEELELQKIELENFELETEIEKSKVAGLISQVSVKIDDYSDQIDDAEKKALEYEKELKKSEEDLKVLRKRLEEELRRSREAAQGKWRTIDQVTFADGDRKLLANLIYCEAGGEPYEGKLAVGAVVINRVLSGQFPDTVLGVIYQKGQFSPVASGRFELALAQDKATAACYQAADEAMRGVTNVGTCVFFRTPVPGLTGINIGGHVFY
ncbi:MAG: cell wall hydrolase [Lachnospiraceae bacterium]|nr:cell wall hydrolase [Lachnospiraceae bacterium]